MLRSLCFAALLFVGPILSRADDAKAVPPVPPAPPQVGIARPPAVEFKLPAIGETVPLDQIEKICAHYGLNDLWEKIRKDPPRKPFSSDGCTNWMNESNGVSIYPACFLHDLKYWAGYPGEDVERLTADAELMVHVARLLKSTHMAEIMFHGVRVGGTEQFHASFSWGFGRQK
jgi:hypothetical protein